MINISGRSTFLIILFCFTTVTGYSFCLYTGDSLIRVTGQVYDSTLKSPIGGVIISYEELPYGNVIGLIKTDELSGHYEFMTFGHDQYRIEVAWSIHTLIVDWQDQLK